jgi:hypothetical protein
MSGAPCELVPRLSNGVPGVSGRCGNGGLTLPAATLNQSSHNENMRPVVSQQRQPLAQVFDAPTWAVPAPGEARLEVSGLFANARLRVFSAVPSSPDFVLLTSIASAGL